MGGSRAATQPKIPFFMEKEKKYTLFKTWQYRPNVIKDEKYVFRGKKKFAKFQSGP